MIMQIIYQNIDNLKNKQKNINSAGINWVLFVKFRKIHK